MLNDQSNSLWVLGAQLKEVDVERIKLVQTERMYWYIFKLIIAIISMFLLPLESKYNLGAGVREGGVFEGVHNFYTFQKA